MEITPYNHHREDSFLPSVFGPQIKTTGSIESSLLSNQSFAFFARAGTMLHVPFDFVLDT
jgi:hypothetical protein